MNGFLREPTISHLKSFDIINGFVVDYMHNILLGVCRQFAKYWFKTNKKPYSLKKDQRKKVNDLIVELTSHSQVGRLSRPLEELRFWKAREWEN